jgi:predicted lipoprotein with Yx(FWY)xxD motif
MFRSVIIAAALLLFATEAFAHGSEAAAPPPPPKDVPPPVTLGKTKKGTVLADSKGMTLYYFDRDDSGNKSTCDGKCTEKWIPLAADKAAQASGDFTVIVRSDGSKMWAYRYRPLYTSPDDKAPGDTNGFDPQNLWHIARPAN